MYRVVLACLIMIFSLQAAAESANDSASPATILLAQFTTGYVTPDYEILCICTNPKSGLRYRALLGGNVINQRDPQTGEYCCRSSTSPDQCPDYDSGAALYDGCESTSGSSGGSVSIEGGATIDLADPNALAPIENTEETYFMAVDHYLGRNGRPRDDRKAFALFMRAANQGNSNAQVYVGTMHAEGRGVPQNHKLGFQWNLRAAEAGNLWAQDNVGWKYRWGLGTPRDDRKARIWFRRSADQGHAPAMRALGLLYQDGLGVQQSYDVALQWFRKSADNGDFEAMNDIGVFYHQGLGVSRDFTTAAKWYQRGANGGDPLAMKNLSRLYEHGLGVPKDSSKARYWRQKAAAAS